MKTLLKIFKMFVGLALLPFCIGAGITLYEIFARSALFRISFFTTLLGMIVWTIAYYFIPTPKIAYVFGHEMTHALWSIIFGGKLKAMKVGSGGGHVLTTKSNFVTALSPYFFPFYSFIGIAIYSIANMLRDLSGLAPLFYFLLGVSYAFHITLTSFALKTKQSDITEQGYIFSAVIILLGNALTLISGIALFSGEIGFIQSIDMWVEHSAKIYSLLVI